MGFNEIGSVGATAIIRGCKKLKKLRMVHLDGNMLPTEDVLALQEAFGEKLVEMEDNISDDDVDFDLTVDSGDSEDSDKDKTEEETSLLTNVNSATARLLTM